MQLPRVRYFRKRPVIILFVALFTLYLIPYNQSSLLQASLYHFSYQPDLPEEPPGTWSSHPVVLLHERAKARFQDLQRRQSTTPGAAEAEYVGRYGRAPPPGFRRWVEHALAKGSPIIDDFDILTRAVHRFANLAGAGAARRMRSAASGNQAVEVCAFGGKKGRRGFGPGCRKFAEPLTALLGDARNLAPDVEFLINFLDEPSVLVTNQDAGDAAIKWEDLSHRSIQDAVAEACRHVGGENSTRTVDGEPRIDTHGLPFVKDIWDAKNLCKHPEYSYAHGFVMSPPSLRQMPSLVPLLSQAAPAPFADILFPSTHYGLKSSLYSSWKDMKWESKINAAYWAGSSTGGHWTDATWSLGHRQRLVALGKGKLGSNYTYLRPSSRKDETLGVGDRDGGNLETFSAPADAPDLTARFDVSLTKLVGCATADVCDSLGLFLGLPAAGDHETTRHPESRSLRYRLALDLDGNSYSGRFHRLLASRSCPVRVGGVFREWHDDRLVPWLHYVPVSVSMAELPELVRFLTGTREGQQVARAVAEAGREWYARAVAPLHQGLYLYRLMLELAWLVDESRPVEGQG